MNSNNRVQVNAKTERMHRISCLMILVCIALISIVGFTGCRAGTVTKDIISSNEVAEDVITVPKNSAENSVPKATEQEPEKNTEASEEEPKEENMEVSEEESKEENTEVSGDELKKENTEVSEEEPKKEDTEMQMNENNKSIAKKFSEAGALHVEGIQLTDSTGAPIQLRGTSTHGLSWFPQYVNREFFSELGREWNVNVVRLAMYTAENGGYCTDGNREELKKLVKDGIEYATDADLYVIVDWHILSDGNPHTHKEEAKKFFEEISGEFSDHENIIYEICNEPNGDVSWADIKSYAEEIIPIIRANDEDAVIIVGTPTWSQDVDKAVADPITAYDNIMYTLHFYAATHTDWLRNRMINALNAGLPIFVSEFGTCDASGSGSIDYEQSDAWIRTMDEKGVSYVTWSLSNKGETSAIFVTDCPKTAGFVQEDLSENGQWIFEMLTGKHAKALEKEVDRTENAVVKPGIENSEEDAGQEQQEEGKQQTVSMPGQSGELQYTAVISNSWEAEGKSFYQYNLALKNNSQQDISEWKIEISFSDEISLSDGWNGNYTVEGNVLEITSEDYNGQVAAGGEITDVGFIISGSDNLRLKNDE